ncbi:hypothetical protein FEM48_ZijujUnG0064100 [Ziziphus jujuba var. spinosa]|uniref:Protein kinase domain-containing protein n=1 Tax=Ziziphus jujuba var. spinosa TaxID=714518 RepID=A0A978U8X6_ZIZJJ|nr:hypothetical protein FEM48_ZijujUnG0064100 [Ziziphus jujuba var. spinosa]
MEEDGTTLCNCDGIRVGDYILESKLGEGSFSVVWKAQHSLTGQQVALKQVYLSKLNRHLRSCLNCELTFLSSVNRPNIIRLFHVFQLVEFMLIEYSYYACWRLWIVLLVEANSPHPPGKSCIFLVLEFCAGGNLASYINQHGRVQEQIVGRFMQQLGAALELLHSHHIIHRDLKPEVNVQTDTNIVLTLHLGFKLRSSEFRLPAY